MKKLKLAVTILFSNIALYLILPLKVKAADGLCGIFPCTVASPCLGTDCGTDSLSLVGTLLEIVLGLIFVGIVIYGIWLIVQAALKIVRSEGNEEQVQAGMKLIKGAYIGIALIFVGLIGLAVVFAVFNATDIFKVGTPDTPPGINLE